VPFEPTESPGKPGASFGNKDGGGGVTGPGDRERGSPDEKGLSDLAAGYRKASPYIAASTSLVAAVGLFTWLGIWLDGKFGTSPWLTVLGVVAGMTGGFISFFKTVLGTKK